MLRGLSSAGLGALKNSRQLVELAAANGFQSVDLDAFALVQELGVEEASKLLTEHKLVIGSIGLPVEWRQTEEKFQQGLTKLAEHAAAAAALGCTRCCTYILPATDYKAAHFMALATRRLKLCAQLLGAFGIRLGLEFVGPHHLRTLWANPFIWTLEETLDWIGAIGEPNVGLLLDAYHWYTNELSVADLEALRADQIVHVHINDAPAVPIDEVLDNGRLYPGEGVINLAGFLQALVKIGYDGFITQEILTAEQPKDSPELLAQRSKAAFDRVFAKAGI